MAPCERGLAEPASGPVVQSVGHNLKSAGGITAFSKKLVLISPFPQYRISFIDSK